MHAVIFSVCRVVTLKFILFSREFLSDTKEICSAYINEVVKSIEKRKNPKNLDQLIFTQTDKLLKMRLRHLARASYTDILYSW